MSGVTGAMEATHEKNPASSVGGATDWVLARKLERTSGRKGVYWDSRKRKWDVRIQVMGRQFFIGLFDAEDKEAAHAAYVAASIKHFGEFAR